MEFNTLKQLTVEFDPQQHESSMLVFKFDPYVWPVDEIKEMFNMSKAAFKRALGTLMKARKIKQSDGWTEKI